MMYHSYPLKYALYDSGRREKLEGREEGGMRSEE
jgi:hypothetical protein